MCQGGSAINPFAMTLCSGYFSCTVARGKKTASTTALRYWCYVNQHGAPFALSFCSLPKSVSRLRFAVEGRAGGWRSRVGLLCICPIRILCVYGSLEQRSRQTQRINQRGHPSPSEANGVPSTAFFLKLVSPHLLATLYVLRGSHRGGGTATPPPP